jgi:hypothetical protein
VTVLDAADKVSEDEEDRANWEKTAVKDGSAVSVVPVTVAPGAGAKDMICKLLSCTSHYVWVLIMCMCRRRDEGEGDYDEGEGG